MDLSDDKVKNILSDSDVFAAIIQPRGLKYLKYEIFENLFYPDEENVFTFYFPLRDPIQRLKSLFFYLKLNPAFRFNLCSTSFHKGFPLQSGLGHSGIYYIFLLIIIFVTNFISLYFIFLLFNHFIQVIKNQFNVLVVIYQLLFYFFNFKFYT